MKDSPKGIDIHIAPLEAYIPIIGFVHLTGSEYCTELRALPFEYGYHQPSLRAGFHPFVRDKFQIAGAFAPVFLDGTGAQQGQAGKQQYDTFVCHSSVQEESTSSQGFI